MKKIESLQAYRGTAAVLVVLYHVTAYLQEKSHLNLLGGFFLFGFTGVDLFFVLSGFIIFYVNRPSIGYPQQFVPYIVKRLIRIYPIYVLITLAKLAAVVVVPGYAKPYETQLPVIIESLLLIPQANLPLIGAAWTLSYELFFYVLFGMAILLGYRYAAALTTVWVIGIVAQVVWPIQGGGTVGFVEGFVFSARNLEFLAGALSGYLVGKYATCFACERRLIGVLLLGTGLCGYLAAGSYIDQGNDLTLIAHTAVFGLASFMIVTGSALAELTGYLRPPRLVVFLGDASYSIYLLAFAFVNAFLLIANRLNLFHRVGVNGGGILIAALAVAGGCAVYRGIEQPLLSHLRRILGSRTARTRTQVPTIVAVS